jgi:4-amino-4-deoxy-L-arabinose transferase-like glycosyltransferase
VILTWVREVYVGPDGAAHLKVFFWNNLVGRFAHVEAPEDLQYAAAHRNSPGKYFIELSLYLWPWTLLCLAAARRAWGLRHGTLEQMRPVRFAVAAFAPSLGVLSVAATARNIYLAPALPGAALLLGWWVRDVAAAHDRWDRRALRGTSLLLLLAVLVTGAAAAIIGRDSWDVTDTHIEFIAVVSLGLMSAATGAIFAWRAAGRGLMLHGLFGLLLAYCALLVAPASQIYRRVDAWQDLATIGRAIGRDAAGRAVVLFAPDETTRAFIDMYAQRPVELIPGPVTTLSTERLRAQLATDPLTLVVTLLPGRSESRTFRELKRSLGLDRSLPAQRPDTVPPLAWASELQLRIAHLYALPNGRRYAVLDLGAANASR